MFWRLPIGETLHCTRKPTDLDLILKWYERNCPERSVHINTGIDVVGELDHSISPSSQIDIKTDIASVKDS